MPGLDLVELYRIQVSLLAICNVPSNSSVGMCLPLSSLVGSHVPDRCCAVVFVPMVQQLYTLSVFFEGGDQLLHAEASTIEKLENWKLNTVGGVV